MFDFSNVASYSDYSERRLSVKERTGALADNRSAFVNYFIFEENG